MLYIFDWILWRNVNFKANCCSYLTSLSSSQLENLWFKEKAVSYQLLFYRLFFFHTWTSNSRVFQFDARSHFSIRALFSDSTAANKTGRCSCHEPMQTDPPSLPSWNVNNKNKTLNSSLATSQCVIQTLQRRQLMNVVCW